MLVFDLQGISLDDMLGLFIGKQAGVFGFSWLAIKFKIASLPKDSSWIQLYGVAVLTGIGFTMSFFIDSLAHNDTKIYHYADKLAILIGFFVSGTIGYIILRMIKKSHN